MVEESHFPLTELQRAFEVRQRAARVFRAHEARAEVELDLPQQRVVDPQYRLRERERFGVLLHHLQRLALGVPQSGQRAPEVGLDARNVREPTTVGFVADYEFSTGYAESIMRAIKRSPKANEIYGRISPEAMRLFDNPWSSPWHPAKLLEEIGEASVAELGENAFEELTRVTMKERIGPILMPMLKTTLAAKSPANILKKLQELTKVAVRGVGIQYQNEGEGAGLVQIVYPRPVAKHVVTSWVGVIKFVFDITSPGEVRQSTQSDDGATLQYFVTWTEPAK